MMRAYSVDDVRTAEEAAMHDQADGELMALAAAGLAQVAGLRLGDGVRVAVLVGAGNNGGDALYAAAHLASAGHNVAVVRTATSVHQGGLDAAVSAGAIDLQWSGGGISDDVRDALTDADLVIDGIFGIGGRPGLPAHLVGLRERCAAGAYVLAVDLPSGCDPAGLVDSDRFAADETVTFGMLKPVHLLPATQAACGVLTVIDIGLTEPVAPVVERLTHQDGAELWPVPGRDDDKYSRGVLGIIAGGEHYTGAAVMAVTAAVTAGAGMVRYIGPDAPTGLLRQLVPEAVFGVGRVQAWSIGSGMEPNDASQEQLDTAREAIASDLPVLLDAGGLDLLEAPRSAPTLLTPHAGELLRLARRLHLRPTGHLGDDGELADDAVRRAPVQIAQLVADHLGVTVLLKGSTTIVVPPAGAGLPIRSQSDAPSWLATAGSGDVLAGLAGMLLAAGLPPLDAGSLAALVHGVAGDRANPDGPLRALDIAHEVGATVAYLLRTARTTQLAQVDISDDASRSGSLDG
ncbi:MAG: bifunctional ADP-dependent NAD(P)H-hydrate dehydratase/NAD(P)H-hydrate epimerase [Actinomycetota bacterium]|nr:bifunctional ADP-dependent NAD(P)H-hydrate dehydratase/NAD(P)H-hydrate epimerase [Actinomycetota bacterium]